MKSIGFKNFRKFVDFPEIDFNDITLMVGKNNSGKSTLVKAVLLVIDYLKYQQNHQFSFSTNNIKDVNIVSFDRAICKHQLDNFISFSCKIAPNYIVSIKISGKERDITGRVEEVRISDMEKQIDFTISYSTKTLSIEKYQNNERLNSNGLTSIDIYNSRLKVIDSELKKMDVQMANSYGVDVVKYINDIDSLNKEKQQINSVIEKVKNQFTPSIFYVSYNINLDKKPSNYNFEEYVQEFFNENENERHFLINKREKDNFSDELNEKLEEVNLLLSNKSEIEKSIDQFTKLINNHYYYYWSAETQKQSALFSIRDESNALAIAIHEFCKQGILKGDLEYQFVVNQIKDFEIGECFELVQHVGEAYECNIIDNNAITVSLADKGMGSIQLMTLFFRLASIIRMHNQQIRIDGKALTYDRDNMYYNTLDNVTLVIEEPELNLHPLLQEKLITLFYTVLNNVGIKFIVETHSEYLIRRSQVIVADEKYKHQEDLDDNIKMGVYYFSDINNPYKMNYTVNGKFKQDFEPGFFNIADDAAMELFEKTM